MIHAVGATAEECADFASMALACVASFAENQQRLFPVHPSIYCSKRRKVIEAVFVKQVVAAVQIVAKWTFPVPTMCRGFQKLANVLVEVTLVFLFTLVQA